MSYSSKPGVGGRTLENTSIIYFTFVQPPPCPQMADEDKFERTIALLGRLLRDDLNLQVGWGDGQEVRKKNRNT